MSSLGDRDEPPLLNITGERVALGPLVRELEPFYQRWHPLFDTVSPQNMTVRQHAVHPASVQLGRVETPGDGFGAG